MAGWYANWIDRWETKLANRDTNRVVRPFEWGAEWLNVPACNGDTGGELLRFLESAIQCSDQFYASAGLPARCELSGGVLRFPSAIESPFPSNNIVHADLFTAKEDQRRAVVVLPQWNSDANGHVGLCRLLNKFGITALRLSMAYHDRRKPPELERADYHVSSNIGRTIHAAKQTVADIRSCLSWLQSQGYQRLGLLGTSLGSCMAFIAAAHDERVSCAVFNHVSMYFSDVVWTGLSTRHVRRGLETHLSQDELRRYWAIISPATFLGRLRGRRMQSLLVWAKYDTTFLPEYSQQVLSHFRENDIPHQVVTLPCAHYTTGRFPFNLMDGLAMCRFLRGHL